MDKLDRYGAWVKECRDKSWEPRVASVELRAEGDAAPTLTGYAAKFDKLSDDLGGFREVIRKGAFSRAVREKQDVRALVDHEPSRILGRTKAGTLDIKEDSIGLRVTIRPPDTQLARDLIESMRRGDVDQMSFAFAVREQRWTERREKDEAEDAALLREIIDLDLYDVSVVSFPAYPDTAIAVRCKQLIDEEARLRAKVASWPVDRNGRGA